MGKVEQAAAILKKDDIVIFPTETVFGIGCRLGSTKAIEKLYQIKAREKSKPTSIVVKDLSQAKEFALFNSSASLLAEKFWPGPLTLILRAKPSVPEQIQKNGTVGLRVPSNATLLSILKKVNEPILAPSANFAGKSPTANLASVDRRLAEMVDYVVDENARGEKPSTVIDMTKARPFLLREGPIEMADIEQALGGSFG